MMHGTEYVNDEKSPECIAAIEIVGLCKNIYQGNPWNVIYWKDDLSIQDMKVICMVAEKHNIGATFEMYNNIARLHTNIDKS